MKIRLIGAPDLVPRWQKTLEKKYRNAGREYPNRGEAPQMRIYFDMDDRDAETATSGLKAKKGIEKRARG